MKKRSLILIVLSLLASAPASAVLINGDFSAGLSGWTASGDAQASAGAASFADGAQQGGSTLFQIVALAPGQYTFSFDFMNNLSSAVPTGAFADTFFASLYFANSPGAFDINSSPASSVLQIDHSGALVLAGQLSPSGLGAGWMHLTFLFTNSFANVIPFFELIDLNALGADSGFLIDNVQFDPAEGPVVPEPASLFLIALGLTTGSGLARLRRRPLFRPVRK